MEDINERHAVFKGLAGLKLKAGETLKASYFKAGGQKPMFVITDKIDGTFTLYGVERASLKKVQTAKSPVVLEALIEGKLK